MIRIVQDGSIEHLRVLFELETTEKMVKNHWPALGRGTRMDCC